MLDSLISRIFADGFTWSQKRAWHVLIWVPLAASTYVLWSRWTSSIQRQRESTDNVGPERGASSNGYGNSSGGGAMLCEGKDRNTPEAISKSENRREPNNDGVAARGLVDAAPKRKLASVEYTVGWICAIRTEYVAAQAFLDEKHERPEHISRNDNNDYTLGRVGKHNVVIAVLPHGEYGISSATGVARDMLHSFHNVRIGLMVGIGGGAPSQKHDIRLGDVVVSAPGDGNGGVFQYDFGETIQGQSFHTKGFLDQPPTFLRAAVNGLEAEYETDGHRLEEAINNILETKPRLRKKYERPNPSSDRLYRTGVTHHVNNEGSCEASCGSDPTKLILRRQRTKDEDNPAIHYGLIASANSLLKDAFIRDKLSAEKGVLCFEMEAAGLMNQFPCLVIRGICDYSDTHKNKEWQGYAAMAAAAYTKDLLCRIPPNRVEAEKKIGDILIGLHDVAEEHRDIAKEQLQVQQDLAKERLSEKAERVHQMFRLTTGSRDATYEWYKDRVEARVKDTCLWFLEHEHFQNWLTQDSGPLLVTADPGCGKSVLARYLIDHALPRSASICYFFFKDQDQNTVRQALCALLHQLFSQKPPLIEHAITQFREDGQGLINSTESLWKVLRNATGDPQAGPVIIVLDALDECAELDLTDLVQNVEHEFSSEQVRYCKLKYLLTCRPYEQIMSKFCGLLYAFTNIRIPGEEECETISQEVNRVITHRVNQLSKKKRLSPIIKSHLEKRLQETTHRTYLWVYLVFDYLENENFKKTLSGVESTITTLPRSVNEAYEQILNKSKDHPMVRKALNIILAASRPLTVSEMNIAVDMNDASKSVHDLDLEDEEDFKSRLRSWCGLFVSIYHGKIYFLHQTAREFLLADLASLTTVSSELRWHHSITINHAHAVLAEVCVLYLNLFNSDVNLLTDANGEDGHSVDSHAFLDYSAKNWGAHFLQADITDDAAIVPFALRICDPGSNSYSAWFRIYWETAGMKTTECFTDLMVASYCGHRAVVKLLLDGGAEIDVRDTEYGSTPLSWAAENGHEAVVKALLAKGANPNSKDSTGRTPLSLAAGNGHGAVLKLLLGKDAELESRDNSGRTALSWAAESGHGDTVKALLSEKGIHLDAKDVDCQTPLSLAVEHNHVTVLKYLLEHGADIMTQGKLYGNPLCVALRQADSEVVKLLLEKGASGIAMEENIIEYDSVRIVDYLSHDWKEEDIWTSWRYILKQPVANHSRLENALWRNWSKLRHSLGAVSPNQINWLKDCDITWLYGPLKAHFVPSLATQCSCRNTSLEKNTISELIWMQSNDKSLEQLIDDVRRLRPCMQTNIFNPASRRLGLRKSTTAARLLPVHNMTDKQ